MTQTSLYPISHANSGRGGVIDAVSAARGRVAWSREIGGRPATPSWPAELLVWRAHLLVSTEDRLVLYDSDGKRLWERMKQPGTPAAVATNGLLHYKSPSRFIDAVDLQGNLQLDAAAFPGAMSNRIRVDGFWPRSTDFIAALYQRPQDEQHFAAGQKPGPMAGPKVTLVRNDYPTPYGDWSTRYESEPVLKPLLVPGRSIVALMLGRQVVRVDAEGERELSRLDAPVREVTEWSVDAQDVYTIAGTDQGRKSLVAMSAAGEVLWRWDDKVDSDAWAGLQPPVRLKSGRVYALTEGRVLAVEQGRLLWAYDLRSEGLRHGAAVADGGFEIKDGRLLAKGAARHATGLADGSILVTSGRTLLHITAEGQKRYALALDSDILGSPVIDDRGAAYVTTATHLFKIE